MKKGKMKYFIRMAEVVASASKDPSTKVGAVLVGPELQVISTGYNGFPRGVQEEIEDITDGHRVTTLLQDRWQRPTKYFYAEHSERNAIYNAARHGIPLRGATIVQNLSAEGVCCDYMRALIQCGVMTFIGPSITRQRRTGDDAPQYDASWEATHKMRKEAGVEVITVNAVLEDGKIKFT